MDRTTRRGICDRIQDARNATKMSQAQLGDAIHLGQRSISKFENGEQLPSIEQLFDLADVLKTDPVKLLFDVEKDNFDIAKETGLSDASINFLKQSQKKDGMWEHFDNHAAAVINALLSNKMLIASLYGYLFSDFSELEYFDPFHPNAFHKIETDDGSSMIAPEMQKVKASQVRSTYLSSFEILYRVKVMDELAALRKSEVITEKRKEQIKNKNMADGIFRGMYQAKEIDLSDDERENLIGLYYEDEKGEV